MNMESIKQFIQMSEQIANAEYEKKIVGYVDILGYKKKVLSSKLPRDIWYLNYLLNEGKEVKNEKSESSIVENLVIFPFSDCLYVFAEKKYCDDVLSFLSILYNKILSFTEIEINVIEGYRCEMGNLNLIRGGITYGDVYVNEENHIFFGPAVIKAYEIENQIAKVPRIVIDDSMKDFINRDKGCVKTDKDSKRFLNWKKVVNYEAETELINKIDSQIKEIENKEDDKEDEEKRIIEKLVWIKGYLNEK